MTKHIRLSSGKEALVDDDVYDWLSETKWADDSNGYAIRKVKGKGTTEKMHRLITGAKEGEQVDHINGIPWDNRRENLRIVTNSLNARNRGKYSTNKTGYKGVAVFKNGRFTAQITYNYRKIHLGVFDNEIDAAKAYNKAADHYFGEYARFNLIEDAKEE